VPITLVMLNDAKGWVVQVLQTVFMVGAGS
jgi:hypothetical protein